MNKELIHRFTNISGSVSLDELEIISISKPKYASVDLCIKANMHIPFASIKLYNGNCYMDAEPCFESARDFGEEIERRWKEHADLLKQRDMLLELAKKAVFVYDYTICREPTGEFRNSLTSQNILRMQAIAKAEN